MEIIKATEADWKYIWPIFREIVQGGDTYVYDPEITEEGAKIVWYDPKFLTYIARDNNEIVGAYVIRPNHRDLGAHIANAAYIVAPKYRRKNYGRKLGEHSLTQAKKAGYKAMQFNYVISTNNAAINLWKSLGFKILGTVPEAHQHRQLGEYVDIHIMHRKL